MRKEQRLLIQYLFISIILVVIILLINGINLVHLINTLFYFTTFYLIVFLYLFVAKGGFFDGLAYGFRRFRFRNFTDYANMGEDLPSVQVNSVFYYVIKYQFITFALLLFIAQLIYFIKS